MSLSLSILASGSAGNCAYLETPETRLLIDAGFSGRRIRQRLATLAPRESDVLRLLAKGLSNADIARCLSMTETSVKTYVSRILSKLGCANRVQAALLARDAGQP